MSVWQEWIQRPEKVWVRRCLFHIHLLLGAGAGLYVVLMSVTGSLIVYHNELEKASFLVRPLRWIVNLHENLLFGTKGRFVNGIGAICVVLLCLTGAVIWWPGINDWRRALTVNWRSVFARFSWDLHSALGFWSFLFVLMWGISGAYFAFPQAFNALFGFIDPRDRFTDQTLTWVRIYLTHQRSAPKIPEVTGRYLRTTGVVRPKAGVYYDAPVQGRNLHDHIQPDRN